MLSAGADSLGYRPQSRLFKDAGRLKIVIHANKVAITDLLTMHEGMHLWQLRCKRFLKAC